MNPTPAQIDLSRLGYVPAADGAYDELLGPDGAVRPDWRYLLESLEGLGTRELRERQQKAIRILRDDGATYNVYDGGQADRTWLLDLVPWVIGSEEWSRIESGLIERAELFNLVLRDVYGERSLIRRGILPPEVVFAHGGFLRACDGVRLPGEQELIVHSVDLVRRADGSMCVLADRTQAPSGAGYALENRMVMSRVLPSLFRDSHVHRLAGYYQCMRQKLIDLAPQVATPRIVILSPGAHNETYFEHSYLANYLGFSLVQGADLEVRNGNVWMKSLDGLKRVDVILRRVDDLYCDQVEFMAESRLGVPGLLEVVRAGRVAVANPLGSSVLESPALLRYLPAIARHFLGHEPRLETVRTWWCGDPADLAHVRANFDSLIVKQVYRGAGRHSATVAELDATARKQLLEAVLRDPLLFVAQEALPPSRVPMFDGERMSSRPALLRSFAFASETSYRVLPGGLTRVGTRDGATQISNQFGAISKDTWVLASEPEKQTPLVPLAPREASLAIENTTLPSRVIENLYWMGRYAERAENGLRLMRTVFLQLNGANGLSGAAREILLEAVTRLGFTFPGFVGNPALLADPEAELVSVTVDRERPGSISNCLHAMLLSAEESKEVLSADTQRTINDIRDQIGQLETSLQASLVSAPEEALDPLVSSLLSLAGIVHESMMRGLGWRFIDMGRRLERAVQIVNLCRAILIRDLDDADEAVVLESLLLTNEALISYRRRYRAALTVRDVLELTLLDITNPRSVLYQVEALGRHLAELPRGLERKLELEGEQRHVLEASSRIRLSELAALASADDSGLRGDLDQLFARVHYLLRETSDRLSDRFFEHASGPQQLLRAHRGAE